ncbi:MAG: DNA polymerase IV [Bdellovibrionota bacterium]
MICHVDMDCFYASIEMRERPELSHKPLAVGGEGRRGVICTCNYIARARGVRSAMPGFMARGLCPELVFLPVRMSAYQEESRKVFDEIAGLVERLERTSIDEAYFEAPDDPRQAWDICARIRAVVKERFGLNCSIGIAPNKMLAKIMSGYRKPDAQLMLRSSQVDDFVTTLELRKIPGVGPKAQERFLAEGLRTCGDLQKFSAEELASRYGQWGLQLYERCRGLDPRELSQGRERKSFSSERTLMQNIASEDSLLNHLRALYADFVRRFRPRAASFSKVEKVFVRFTFADFRKTSREGLSTDFDYETFERLALEAYRRDPGEIRLVGLGVRFDVPHERRSDPRQLSLWGKAS